METPKVIVEVFYSGNNYSAHAPELLGCVTTGHSVAEIKKNMKEAIEFHVESSLRDNDPVPDVFKGEYELVFKLSAEALLNNYSNIFTKAALSRITGINQRLLWYYSAGLRKPSAKQAKRITDGLHNLAEELLSVQS